MLAITLFIRLAYLSYAFEPVKQYLQHSQRIHESSIIGLSMIQEIRMVEKETGHSIWQIN